MLLGGIPIFSDFFEQVDLINLAELLLALGQSNFEGCLG
jgi:hypothetical protein